MRDIADNVRLHDLYPARSSGKLLVFAYQAVNLVFCAQEEANQRVQFMIVDRRNQHGIALAVFAAALNDDDRQKSEFVIFLKLAADGAFFTCTQRAVQDQQIRLPLVDLLERLPRRTCFADAVSSLMQMVD